MLTRRVFAALFVALFLLCALFPLADQAAANPLPIAVEDRGPYPENDTAVYLKSEIIEVRFSEVATVNASYTFANGNSSNESQLISLPFRKQPFNLSISCGGEPVPFTWLNLSQTIWLYEGTPTVMFSLDFTTLEERTLEVRYYRSYMYYHSYYHVLQKEGPCVAKRRTKSVPHSAI